MRSTLAKKKGLKGSGCWATSALTVSSLRTKAGDDDYNPREDTCGGLGPLGALVVVLEASGRSSCCSSF